MSIRYETIGIARLVNTAWGDDSYSKADRARWVRDINRDGFLYPIEVVELTDRTFCLIGGEARLAAARELQLPAVPCLVLDELVWEAKDVKKLVQTRLDVITGCLSPTKLASVHVEMRQRYGEEALKELFEFIDRHARERVKDRVTRRLQAFDLPHAKRKELERRTKEARTIQDVERVINELWTRFGSTVPQSYVVFAAGGRSHIYVDMDEGTRRALDRVMAHCEWHSTDINEVVGPALTALADLLDKKSGAAPGVEEDDVVF